MIFKGSLDEFEYYAANFWKQICEYKYYKLVV